MLASCCHAMIPSCAMTTKQTHSVPGIATKDQCLGLFQKTNPYGGRVFSLFVEVVFLSCTAAIPILYLKK
jgi:hypothetical protein